MTTEEKYVAAAYLVVFLVVLLYVVIMAAKLTRLGNAVAELTELAREKKRTGEQQPAKPAPKQVKVG
jgi:flagellar biosynthesis/type III secretory pathway M-ring protein FliF/YscJ